MAVTPDAADPEDLFRDLAANLSKTGATDIVIDEVVSADFQIASMSPPTTGTAEMQSSTALQWKIPELGVTANEGASLQFVIRHTANTAGTKLVNESLTYSDNEGNLVAFPHALGGGGLRNGPAPCRWTSRSRAATTLRSLTRATCAWSPWAASWS